MNIKDYRNEMDRIDAEITKLLEERLDVSNAIGAYKLERGIPVLDEVREAEKLERMKAECDPAKSRFLESVFKSIMAESRRWQAAMGPSYGVLGRTLSHTFSPILHKEFGNNEYEAIEKEPEDLKEYLKGGSFKGINVTIPYKKKAIKYCDELGAVAEETGSVNTVVAREDGKLVGYNTDYYGFKYMVNRAEIEVEGCKVLVLGSGGASAACCVALRDMGAKEVVVISRSGENNYKNLDLHKDADVIVNATPVGMYPHAERAPIDIKKFPSLKGVVDVVYNPLRTRLVLEAKKAGIKATGGLPMLVAQGARSHELFTGEKVDIDEVLSKLTADLENIVIIGMPGSGKSRIGKELAELLGKEFVDSDDVIVQNAGQSIIDIIHEDGVVSFRTRESKIVKGLMGTHRGAVIALGGGVVERRDNYNSIKGNGIVVHLKRPEEDLATEGRPISMTRGLKNISERRMPIYEAWADVEVDNIGIAETAELLKDKFC